MLLDWHARVCLKGHVAKSSRYADCAGSLLACLPREAVEGKCSSAAAKGRWVGGISGPGGS